MIFPATGFYHKMTNGMFAGGELLYIAKQLHGEQTELSRAMWQTHNRISFNYKEALS